MTTPKHTSLPPQTIHLIGRDLERQTITQAVNDGQRLITLVGPGGVGKTRLALNVAHDLRKDFDDGVDFVDLTPISDAENVSSSIASALGLRVGTQSPLEVVIDYLQTQHLLLVLDNLEHLRAAWRTVSTLLEACPKLVIVATSREALRQRHEFVIAIAPLQLPKTIALEQAEHSSAIELFLERAREVRPSFALSPENILSVIELVRRLDGLPLALELAASRVNLLTAEAMVNRLDALGPLPTRGANPDAPERHRTLEAAMAWSVDALEPNEIHALEQLSGFTGGWTLEAAETAVGPDFDGDVLEVLSNLADRHLIVPVLEDGGQARFTMLETVRAFNLGRLKQRGTLEAAGECHTRWVLQLVQTCRRGLRSSRQGETYAALERELDNIRAALNRSLEAGSDIALQIAAWLGPFWFARHASEGHRWLERSLSSTPQAALTDRAIALDALANLNRLLGHLDEAERSQQAALGLLTDLGDLGGQAMALNNLAVTARYQCHFERAIELHRDALEHWNELADRENTIRARNGIGLNLMLLGRLEEAQQTHETNLIAAHASGNNWLVALAMSSLGTTRSVRGEASQAIPMMQEALRLARSHGDQPIMVSVLLSLGSTFLQAKQYEKARDMLEETLELTQRLDNTWDTTTALGLLGQVLLEQGDHDSAQATLEEAVRQAWRLRHWQRLARTIESLSQLALRLERPTGAATLYRMAQGIRGDHTIPMLPVEQLGFDRHLIRIRERLGLKTALVLRETSQHPQTNLLEQIQTALHAVEPETPRRRESLPGGLSARELEVLRLVADGQSNKQIGRALGVTEHTARFHVTGILNKLGASTRTHAVMLATQLGVLETAQDDPQ
jgi:predicted ATPase/DNA-binding CsgD family transcriptional regulator